MPVRICKYEDAFNLIGVKYTEKVKEKLKQLENEGHTEKSICFAIWKAQIKLMTYKYDNRFWSIFINEINKWSWKKDDKRWEDYSKKKNEIAKAEAIRKQLVKDRALEFGPKLNNNDGFVYFIQGECGGAIKVGFAKDVSNRLKTLQTGYPDKLKIILIIPGNYQLEAKIHSELEGYKLNGEWFKPYEFVLNKIKGYARTYNKKEVAK